MGVIQSEEPRTFEQRFGTHCPFCGRGWGSAERCDPIPSNAFRRMQRRTATFPARQCVICEAMFTPAVPNANCCSRECREEKARRRQRRPVRTVA